MRACPECSSTDVSAVCNGIEGFGYEQIIDAGCGCHNCGCIYDALESQEESVCYQVRVHGSEFKKDGV